MSMRTWILAAGVMAAMSMGSRAALAQTPPTGGDEVMLKNGGVVRGTVVTMDPGKEVVVVVQGLGETRTIPWVEVDRVHRGESAPAAVFPGAPLATLTPLPPPQPGELGAPRIHIESDVPVSLREATLSFDGIRHPAICRTPCDTVVDGRSGRAFYFAGDDVPESSRFLLTEKSGGVTASVSTGNASLRSAGDTFLTLGVLSATTGAVLLPIGLVVNAARNSQAAAAGPNGVTSTSGPPIPLVGGVMLGAGAAVLAAGIVMRVVGTTRYEFKTTAGATQAVVEPGVIRF